MSIPDNLQKFVCSKNTIQILKERYLAKKEDRTQEQPEELFWRVSSTIAEVELQYVPNYTQAYIDEIALSFYNTMVNKDFMPNTPCLVNAGRPLSMLSACFVLPVGDSIDEIFYAVKAQAMIQKSGGGTGFSFGELRHRGAGVHSTGKDSSGPLAFMKVFNAATDSIKQGGVRRGANMGCMRVNHPDIFEFIKCKKELDNENLAIYNRFKDSGKYTEEQLVHIRQELLQTQMNNFNISVGISNEFMLQVKVGGKFDLKDHHDKIVKTIEARDLWNQIIEGAWQNGEPGLLFMDHSGVNAVPGLGPITATNPCGEQYLHPWDSCNLGSINLANFYAGGQNIDLDRLEQVTKLCVRFLDNVIDANIYPLEEIEQMVKGNRRIGLGIMGFADLLIKLKISYKSQDARDIANFLMKKIKKWSIEASQQLGKEKGNFPNKHLSVYKDEEFRRNAALLSIAPTGTISMIAGCSFGCEPHFGIAYTKHVMKDSEGRAKNLYYVNEDFEDAILTKFAWKDLNQEFQNKLYQDIADNNGSVQGIPEVPEEIQKYFVVTQDISVEEHILMLAAFQEHVCNAVSKTINAPFEHKKEEVEKAIWLAYNSGCKGFTYYRNGSRTEEVVTTKKEKKHEQLLEESHNQKKRTNILSRENQESMGKVSYRSRPDILIGKTIKQDAGCEPLYITINRGEQGEPFEVFIKMGKGGSCIQSYLEALGVSISIGLRSGAKLEKYAEKLRGVRCPRPKLRNNEESKTVLSCADGISQAIGRALNQLAKSPNTEVLEVEGMPQLVQEFEKEINISNSVGMCPLCNSMILHLSGCEKCINPGCSYVGRCS